MLSIAEKILFTMAILLSVYFTLRAALRIIRTIQRGQGHPDWRVIWHRLLTVPARVLSFQPVLRFRLLPSIFHTLLGWGFLYFFLVNTGDLLQGYIKGFLFLGTGTIGKLYRLGGDIFSLSVLLGMVVLSFRRFVLKPPTLSARPDVLLHPKARFGIRRDSAIVASFIILHVGSRFLGESFKLTRSGMDPWQPFASAVSLLWNNWNITALTVGEHIAFWFALGLVLAFLPYFLYSKHIHIFFAPLNFLLKPERRSIG
jgi:hypothetical protein